MEISFYCRASKANRQGLSPIETSVVIDKKRVFINLPLKENSEVFKKSMKSKKSNDIKTYTEAMRKNINSAVVDLAARGIPLTVDSLREYIKNGGIKSYTIEEIFDEYIEMTRGRKVTEGTIKKYEIVKKLFYDFLETKHLSKSSEMTSVKNSIIVSFYNHINSLYETSTAAGMMTKLKSVIEHAISNGYIKVDPFSAVKIKKAAPKIEYLTEEELNAIRNKELHCERLDKVRDLFLFQAASGLSYADMATIGKDGGTALITEEDGTVKVCGEREKTGVAFCACILPDGVAILAKYEGILPLLSNQRYNSYLKEIETLCGLKKSLHTHLARKTYATRCLNRGVRAETLKMMLGHTTTKLTLSTYAHIEEDTIVKEVKRAFNL